MDMMLMFSNHHDLYLFNVTTVFERRIWLYNSGIILKTYTTFIPTLSSLCRFLKTVNPLKRDFTLPVDDFAFLLHSLTQMHQISKIKVHQTEDIFKTKVRKTGFKEDRFLSCIISSSVSKNNLSASWTKMDGKVKQANGLNLTSFLNRYETPATAAKSINAGVDIEYRRRAHIVFWEQYLWFWFGGFLVLHRPSPSDDTSAFWPLFCVLLEH